jgi:hypothetical protein
MALTATLTYDPATRTVAAMDTSYSGSGTYALYRLRDGVDDQLLPTTAVAGGVTYKVPADGVYRLVLRTVGATPVSSQELLHMETYAHYEAVAHSFDKLSARSPKGHPVEDCLKVLARVNEAASCVGESNAVEADRLLTTTNLPS